MIIKVTTVVGNYQVQNKIGHVFRVANFEIQGDRIQASLGSAAGNMLAYNGTTWVAVPPPGANNMHLVSDTALAYKVKWETQPSAGGVASGPQGWGDNYIITPSIAANNLTVALKTIAGTDPTASDTITVRIGNTKRVFNSAISTTKTAGINWFNAGSAELAGKDIDFFVYAIQETGATPGTRIGFARIPHARTMADFVNVNTSEKYIAGNWTNFNTTDEVEVIGRFRAQLSAGAAYTWSIPNAVVINRPVYESDWLEWTPQGGTTTSMVYTINTINLALYRATLAGVFFQMSLIGTTSGVVSLGLTFTLPWSLATTIGFVNAAGGQTTDGGAALSALVVATNPPTIRKYDSSNYTLAASKQALANFLARWI